jgi:ferredoxin-nitrate reductase
VHAEFVALTRGRLCDMAGMSHALLAEHGPQQWPFPEGTAPGGGGARLYGDHHFPTPSGRARLIAEAPLGLAEPPDDTFPLVLTVGRYLGHWHTMTRTVHVERARKQHPGPVLEVHPSDAQPLGLVDGSIAVVCSRRGSVRVPVQLSEAIRPGVVFLPMHWGASQPQACEANRLMHELGCPLSKQPELKAAAVRLEAAHAPAGEAGIQPGQHLSGA